MHPQFPRRVAAFTLIELLTVIAIIGILAAILIPVTGKVRSSARFAKCSSNIRQIGMAMLRYADEHKNTFPAGWGGNTIGSWSTALVNQKYLPRIGTDNSVFVCPDDPNSSTVAAPKLPRSYVLCVPAMAPVNTNTPVSLFKVRSPSRTFMITEWHWSGQDLLGLDGAWAGYDIVVSPNDLKTVGHREGVRNFVYVDGHVRRLNSTEAMERLAQGWYSDR